MQSNDKGNEVYNDQKKFNDMFFKADELSQDEITKHLKEFILNIIRESTEALNTRKFKMHRVEDKEEIVSNTIEELIDVQKYLWGAFQVLGVSWDELIKQYWRKTAVVEQRYFQEHKLQESLKGKKICAIDLDGVLCEYPGPWIKYINEKTDNDFKTLHEAKMGIDLLTYESLKSEYRQSGIKKDLPAIKNASTFTKQLKAKGYCVIILTSRPYKEYNRLFSDTIEWLKNNDIAYDSIMFDERKNIRILKEVPNLEFMVEDNARFSNSVAQLGYKVYYLGDKNENLHSKVTPIKYLLDVLYIENLT